MFKSLRQKIIRKVLGRNSIMHQIYTRECASGHRLKAKLFAFYVLPFRNILRAEVTTKNFTFNVSADYYNELQGLLRISKPEEFELVRVGNPYDGGYIMLNDFLAGSIAYSFGIGGNVSWDRDMASRGYEVFMYDHTIKDLPEDNPHFHYFRQGIAGSTTQNDKLRTLEDFIAVNHHEDKRDMILKMDVEGAEWEFLSSVSSELLSRFSQILFEFHWLNEIEDTSLILEALKKINTTHQLIHLHPCNFSWGISINGKKFCNILEASYIRKDKYITTEDPDIQLPLDIDTPDEITSPDIELGQWNKHVEIGKIFTICASKYNVSR